MNRIKNILKNRWVGFALATTLYLLWFVIWLGNAWFLLGVPIIYDLYISRLFYRYVWSKNERLCEISSLYRNIYEWVNAIVFATVVASLIHIFFFQMYVIPSSSMEKSLLVGDYLYVSKLTYGPKMPNTPISFPFVHHTMPFSQTKKSFSEAIKWPYHRLKGLGRVERGDVVVFNFPAGDTVLLENQAVTYYDVVRQYTSELGEEAGRARLNRDYTIISRPVDKRENYVKRCVGIPGDTIRIIDTELYVNGEKQGEIPGKQYIYFVQSSSPITKYAIDHIGITEWSGSGNYYYMTMTDEAAERVKAMSNVVNVTKYNATMASGEAFPHSENYPWTQDNFGPLWIPQRGATVALSLENLPLYERIITAYEGHTLQVDGEQILIDGAPATEYTFAMDYYWMMGDNRHNSADSRFWGFVPEDHIVGKASFIAFSMGEDGIRWNRLFRKIR